VSIGQEGPVDDELRTPEAVEAQLSDCHVVFGTDDDEPDEERTEAERTCPEPGPAPESDSKPEGSHPGS
jgi:hypothetical protein